VACISIGVRHTSIQWRLWDEPLSDSSWTLAKNSCGDRNQGPFSRCQWEGNLGSSALYERISQWAGEYLLSVASRTKILISLLAFLGLWSASGAPLGCFRHWSLQLGRLIVQKVEVLKKGVVEELNRRLFQFHILVSLRTLAGTPEVNVQALRHIFGSVDGCWLLGLASLLCEADDLSMANKPRKELSRLWITSAYVPKTFGPACMDIQPRLAGCKVVLKSTSEWRTSHIVFVSRKGAHGEFYLRLRTKALTAF